jgi:hypothetical protein
METIPIVENLDFTVGELEDRLVHSDSRVALAALWMFLEPEALQPKSDGSKFTEWDWPRCDLEFDHQGSFIEVMDDEYLYQGGETKFSPTGTDTSQQRTDI